MGDITSEVSTGAAAAILWPLIRAEERLPCDPAAPAECRRALDRLMMLPQWSWRAS